MDGIYEMAAAPFTITIDGQEWTFSPMTVTLWGQLELHILSNRPAPESILEKWIPMLGAEDRRIVLEQAWRDTSRGAMCSEYQVALFESTITGKIFKAWLRLKVNHPDVTLEQADQLLRAMSLQEKQTLQTSEGGVRGNS